MKNRREGQPLKERREARAQRILDAASILILRDGYDEITIEDIAREAEVGKGTLYLHWDSREALFAALLLREKVAMAEDIKQRMTADPSGASLHWLLKHAALALLQRPLLKAALLRDTWVLGEFIQREQSSALSTEVLAGFTAYLETLRKLGLVRTDLSLSATITLFSSIFLGFFLVPPFLPDAFKPSDEQLAELIAETGQRTLEPRDRLPSAELQAASHSLQHYLDHSLASAHEQLQVDEQAAVENGRLPAHSPVRARGRNGGRSKKLRTTAQIKQVRHLYNDKSLSIDEICATLGISRASFYRYLREAEP